MIGYCLWDVFSDNHEVIGKDGKVYDTGSFRGSGGFIADYINSHFPQLSSSYDYLDFYMGSIWVNERADLTPVYLWIFRNLKRLQCDWIYSFPRMHLVSFDKSGEEEKYTGPLEYDPNKAVLEELEKREKEESVNRLREELDEAYHKDVEEAKYKPLPKTVQAYKDIYGRLPRGWPHQ
jgi:hypothetical protein